MGCTFTAPCTRRVSPPPRRRCARCRPLPSRPAPRPPLLRRKPCAQPSRLLRPPLPPPPQRHGTSPPQVAPLHMPGYATSARLQPRPSTPLRLSPQTLPPSMPPTLPGRGGVLMRRRPCISAPPPNTAARMHGWASPALPPCAGKPGRPRSITKKSCNTIPTMPSPRQPSWTAWAQATVRPPRRIYRTSSISAPAPSFTMPWAISTPARSAGPMPNPPISRPVGVRPRMQISPTTWR